MPRLLVLADLHLDRWDDARRDPLALMPEGWFTQFDMLILAGDLVDKPKVRLKRALARIGQLLPLERVQYFPGNHCYYAHTLDGEDRIESIVTEAGAGFAQARRLDLGRTRILSCTLWTDLLHPTISSDIIASDLERGMNDYRYIRLASAGYRKTWPSDMRAVHQRHLAWLRAEMEKPHDGPTIIVTHHAPILEHLGTTGTLGHAYGSDLTGFIEETKSDLWLYGHTHRPHEVEVGTTRVRNVSFGYPFELSDDAARARIEAAVIEVDA